MSARRVVDWQVKPDGDDYSLSYRGRPVSDGQTMTDVRRYLHKNRTPGEQVVQVAEDGYVTDLTDQIARRQPRRRQPGAKGRRPVRMPLIRF